MTNEAISRSVRQGLQGVSRARQEDFQLTLVHFAIERLLYRLSLSEASDRFVLKGAMLFTLWSGQGHRATRDLDLAGRGDPDPERLSVQFRRLCTMEVEDDGVHFDADSVQVDLIRAQQEYQGQRVRLLAHLGTARIQVQIDVGFGDAVTPPAEWMTFPTLLDLPAPRLRVCPKETVVAEKLHAMTTLGLLNSRMKDFYDLDWLARSFAFDGLLLATAIRATFVRRQTDIPHETPISLTPAFVEEPTKQVQWQAFLRRSGLGPDECQLAEVIARLHPFLVPPLLAAGKETTFSSQWAAGGPWQP